MAKRLALIRDVCLTIILATLALACLTLLAAVAVVAFSG